MLNVYGGVMDTNLVLPLGVDRCRVVFDFYFAAGTDEEFVRDSVAVADQVQAEDVGICEEVQRGLNSRSYVTGPVQREAGERRATTSTSCWGSGCGEFANGAALARRWTTSRLTRPFAERRYRWVSIPGRVYRAGLLFGLIAYVWWGLVPLYFRQVKHVPAGEILAHRIVWSILLMLGLTGRDRRLGRPRRVLRSAPARPDPAPQRRPARR